MVKHETVEQMGIIGDDPRCAYSSTQVELAQWSTYSAQIVDIYHTVTASQVFNRWLAYVFLIQELDIGSGSGIY